MRMFRITINGKAMPHQDSRGRTPEEFQHHLTHVDGHRYVRVVEWVSGGARSPERDVEDPIE